MDDAAAGAVSAQHPVRLVIRYPSFNVGITA
jgi:hypothetical protein